MQDLPLSADTASLINIMLLLLGIGAVSGFLSGLLGVGGGVLFVPALFFALTSMGYDPEYAMHIALGSSLLIVFATGSTSAYQHYKRGAVDLDRVRLWGPFIVAGVITGSFFAAMVPGEHLKKIFAVVTMLIAIYMAFNKDRAVGEVVRTIQLKIQKAFCLLIGIVSSMIGVGGAILTIPLMTYIGVPMQRAVGTGAALGILISLPGALTYMIMGSLQSYDLPPYSIGYVNFLAVAAIVPASVLLAPMGVRAAHKMPKAMLRRVFAAVLIIVSIRMMMTL